jgi:2'-5' RNA ligase
MTSSGDYRIFVGAFPSGGLAERIQLVRERHDAKTARITAPHVTVAGTYWRTGPASPENEAGTIARLQAVQAQIQPFELVLGGIQSFLPGTPVIYLHVGLTDGLLAARRQLLETLGSDKHRHYAQHHYAPHLTLTMRLDKSKTQSLLAQLQQSEWHTGRWTVPIDHLWLMQRGPDDPAWRYIHRIELSGKR